MENKFGKEVERIEALLNKVDIDLNTDFEKTDFSTFFRNVDKSFECYNICLEELCNQLYLLELPVHSKVFRKLYHHYKHQLYNIMKYQLTIQKELNEKAEEDKNHKIKIETLNNKLKATLDKKTKLQSQVEEQRIKIEKLILSNAQGHKYQDNEFKNLIPQATENWRELGKSLDDKHLEGSRNNLSMHSSTSSIRDGTNPHGGKSKHLVENNQNNQSVPKSTSNHELVSLSECKQQPRGAGTSRFHRGLAQRRPRNRNERKSARTY